MRGEWCFWISLDCLRLSCPEAITSQFSMNPQTMTTFETRRHRQFDHEIGHALSRDDLRGVLERHALMRASVSGFVPVVQPDWTQNSVVKVARLDDAGCLAIRVQDAAVVFP